MPGRTARPSLPGMTAAIDDLEPLSALASELSRRARAAGAMLVWRAQSRSTGQVVVRGGKVEGQAAASVSGHGVQVYTEDGRTALASRDDFEPDAAVDLLARAIAAARSGTRLGLVPSRAVALEPVVGREIPPESAAHAALDLGDVGRRLVEIEAEVGRRVPGVRLRAGYRAVLDAWRIVRSDGTDVTFAVPRTTVSVHASSADDDTGRHGVGTAMHGADPRCPFDAGFAGTLMDRAARAAGLARDLPSAPSHPAGSFPLVIDYALAKGLAHEAFGHAAEADGFRSSVLARDGRLRAGEPVGAEHVSIVDEPVAGDHAWQPVSANGVRRRPAVIVERGRLRDALTDPWSAAACGSPLTGAGRAESFRHAPVPRMTNIRIEVEGALPAPGPFERYGPEEVRDLLAGAGVFRRHPRVSFLSGYGGGQVNSTTGDFVFHCKAIWVLGEDGVRLHRPAIFSGSMFGALRSVREAFGPLRLDALGTCGKWGQSVPSSGGSHYFLVLDPDPAVRLGGR